MSEISYVCSIKSYAQHIFNNIPLTCAINEPPQLHVGSRKVSQRFHDDDCAIDANSQPICQLRVNRIEKCVKTILLYDDDPLEIFYTTGLFSGILVQVAWMIFHIGVFLALLLAIRTLVLRLKAKYKANNISRGSVTAIKSATTTNASAANCEIDSDIKQTDADGSVNKRASSSLCHSSKSKKRASASAGAILSNLKLFEFELFTDTIQIDSTAKKTAVHVCV